MNISLTDWVPVLAKEIYGTKWSPNCDFIIHLQAQGEAGRLGIAWRRDMPVADVERLVDAVLDMHRKD